MDDEKDLSVPKNNDFIPQEKLDQGVIGNDLIPEDHKSSEDLFAERILGQLEDSESCQVGSILIQRRHLHGEGQEGGENFSVLDADSGCEKAGISLTQLAKLKNEAELRGLLDD